MNDPTDILGPRPAENPTPESILGPRPAPAPLWTGTDADMYAAAAPGVGDALRAFGQGAETAWESGTNLGYSDDVTNWMKKVGIYSDAAKGQGGILRTYNEALIRPAVTALFAVPGAIMRGMSAAYVGAEKSILDTTEQMGIPNLGRAIVTIPEAFPLAGAELGGFRPHVMEPPLSVPEVMQARDLGLIGPERAPSEMLPVGSVARHGGPVSATMEGEGFKPYTSTLPPDMQPPTVEPPATIHTVARSIDPETFSDYDSLGRQRDVLRQKLADAQVELQQKAEAQAPHQAEIDDLQRRLQDTTPRLAKKYEARLAALVPERDAFLSDPAQMAPLLADTAEMASQRRLLMETDQQMRDLSPAVTAAYRKAGEQFPEPEEAPAPEVAAAAQETVPAPPPPQPVVAAEAPAAPAEAPAPSEPVAPVPAPTEAPVASPVDIRTDVAAKLMAAGRPLDEANAASELVAAHYEARAERFQGAKGTAADLYAKEAPAIRAGGAQAAVRVPEMAQARRGRIRIANSGRATITLMRDANASTFLHETGHHWLEELLSDARDPVAPNGLRDDAATTRKWLGADADTAITTRQHEKFARGFERYIMEGVAPSRGLEGVFAKFRGWLTKIYQTVQKLRAPINDDIRDVYDRLLATENERATIASDREAPDLFAEPETKPAPLYETLPKEPKRLIQFLKEPIVQFPGTIHERTIPGGLRDAGGDVSAIIGGPKGRPGLINKEGAHLDDATLRAYEAGYFPEHDQRPEINHLLEAIREDHNGNPRYSMHDQEAVDAYHAALDRNAEIDRLASEHGIDTKGLTREQFFDKVTEKLSAENAAEEIRSQEDSNNTDFSELDAEIRDTTEPPWYGIAEPRSLDDLENAYRQENDARSARQGDAGDTGPERAPGPADAGKDDRGQGGRGAGTEGRAGAEAGQPGGGEPSDLVAPGPDESESVSATKPGADELVDKAGNIRLDNLNSDEDVKQVLRDLAAQNADFMVSRGGGVISDVQRREMADNLGLTVENFSPQKPPGVTNSVWTEAVQRLTFQASDEVSRLGKVFGDSGSAADGAAYLQAKQRLLMIADHFAGLTAESGRSLRVFDKRGISFTGDLIAKMQQDTGRTLYQMQQEAKAVGALDTTAQRAKMVQDTRDLTRAEKIKSGIISYFINNLISGPITHAAYAVGNAVWSTFKAVPLTLAEATIDTARATFGKAPEDRVYFGEVGAQIYGMMHGAIDGFVPGVKAFKTGISYMEGADRLAQAASGGTDLLAGISPMGEAMLRQNTISEGLKAIKVPGAIADKAGYALETPSRGVSAIHTVFYAMNYERDIARQAFRAAANEGLTGLDFSNRVAELTQSPSLAMVRAAHDEALQAVLMKRPVYGGIQSKIVSAVNDSLPLKIVMPFMQIGMNILEEGLVKTSPIGIASQAVRDNLAGRNGEIARTQQYARIMVGSGVVAGVMGLAADGILTGGGPSNPRELALKEAMGWKAYSIRIGDTYVPYRKYLGPLGPLVGGAANIYDVAHLLEQGAMTKAIGAGVLGFSEVVANETWMAGLSNLIEATRHYDTEGERYLRNLALGFMPFSSGLSQTARLTDDYQREVHSWTAALRNKLPGLSEGLYPQRDWTGQPIASRTMMSPSVARNDKTMAQMEAVEFYPAKLHRQILGVPLTDQQYDDYARVAGMLAKRRMDALVNTAGFTNQPAGFQHKMMSDTLTAARKAAATYVEIQPGNGGILRQATAAKQAAMEGKTQAEVKAIRQGAQ